MKKFSVVGTNCAGKTTMILDITSRLKMRGLLADCVVSQDRKVFWSHSLFATEVQAHLGVICNLITKEVQACLSSDVDICLVDRSVVDLYSYAITDFPEERLVKDLKPTILSWAETYEALYYLEPLPYQYDTKRPDDAFRLKANANLLNFIYDNKVNVSFIPRNEVYGDICNRLGLKKVLRDDTTNEEWQRVANRLDIELSVNRISASSHDYDVWIYCDLPLNKYAIETIRSTIKDCVTKNLPTDLHIVPKGSQPLERVEYVYFKPNQEQTWIFKN